MKKIYNQPSTEVLLVNTENMMQGVLNVSVNNGGHGGGVAGAPGRGDIIP